MFAEPSSLLLPDADLRYAPHWLAAPEAAALLATLRATLNWQQQPIRMFGRWVLQPRLTAWYGDTGAGYTYSGLHHAPLPWTTELLALRQRLIAETGFAFNSVLCNCYRNGTDSMGWHSDDEPELGNNPTIASVSLGGPRRFLLRRKTDHRSRHELVLESGSLLLMHGTTQHQWQHSLPRTARPVAERINLTFRQILSKT